MASKGGAAKVRKVPGGKGAAALDPAKCRGTELPWDELIKDVPTKSGIEQFVCPECGRAVRAKDPTAPRRGLADHGQGSRRDKMLAEVAYARLHGGG